MIEFKNLDDEALGNEIKKSLTKVIRGDILNESKANLAIQRILKADNPSFYYKTEFTYPDKNVTIIWVYYCRDRGEDSLVAQWMPYFRIKVAISNVKEDKEGFHININWAELQLDLLKADYGNKLVNSRDRAYMVRDILLKHIRELGKYQMMVTWKKSIVRVYRVIPQGTMYLWISMLPKEGWKIMDNTSRRLI